MCLQKQEEENILKDVLQTAILNTPLHSLPRLTHKHVTNKRLILIKLERLTFNKCA